MDDERAHGRDATGRNGAVHGGDFVVNERCPIPADQFDIRFRRGDPALRLLLERVQHEHASGETYESAISGRASVMESMSRLNDHRTATSSR